jgi:hypothetical protein
VGPYTVESNQQPYSIRIFLPTGDPDGLRLVEKSNWSGIGVVFNRTNYKQAVSRAEFSRTGVYVLIGQTEDSTLPTVYIGEGDPVKDRLNAHYAKKDFWEWAIFFVTKDNSLNKAHVQRMEFRLIEMAKAAKLCKLDNANSPTPPTLSEAETADVDGFILNTLGIFPLLGLGVFETAEPRQKSVELLYIEAKGIKASGYEDSKGFVVAKGSQMVSTETPSLAQSLRDARKDLIEQSVVTPTGSCFTFEQDHVFSSPSAAACVVQGRSVNGRDEWKNKDGRSLKTIQAANFESSE